MQKIRSNAALMVVLIGLAMVAFILSDMFKNIGGGGSGIPAIGEIFGEQMDTREFLKLYETNLLNEGNPSEQERKATIWQRTWDGFINQKMFDREYSLCGNSVSNKELNGLFNNPPPNSELRNIPDFKDQVTGQYSPERFFSFYNQAREITEPQNDQEKRMREYMKSVEEYVYLNRLRDKYFGLLKKSAFTTGAEAERMYQDQNRKLDMKYLFVSFATMPDAEVEVTKEDLKTYYNNHKEMYRRDQEEVDIRYVYFEKLPTGADTTAAIEFLNKLIPGFQNTKNDTEFISRYAGTLDTVWKPISTLPASVLASADTINAGDVFGPSLDNQGKFQLYKMLEKKEGGDASVHVRHIQFNFGMPPSKADSLATKERADNQKKTITSVNFSDAARAQSEDPNSKNQGGDMGWLTFPSAYGEAYDKAVKNAAKGAFVVTTVPGGYVLVEVLERTTTLTKIASIPREVFAGSATVKSVYQQATRFASEVDKNQGNMEKAAEAFPGMNLRKNPSPITPNTNSMLGLQSPQVLINWALKEPKGTITKEILDTENAFVVAEITDKREQGYKRMEEVEEAIKPNALNNVKAKKIMEKLKGSAGGSLEEIATAYGPGATVQNATGIAFVTSFQNPLGAELKVYGRAFGMTPNEISKPVVGTNGVYLVQVVNVVEAAPSDPQSLESIKFSQKFGKASFFETRTYEALKEIAKVSDQRRNHMY